MVWFEKVTLSGFHITYASPGSMQKSTTSVSLDRRWLYLQTIRDLYIYIYIKTTYFLKKMVKTNIKRNCGPIDLNFLKHSHMLLYHKTRPTGPCSHKSLGPPSR